MAELTATWSPDDADLGTLDVEVQSDGFAGHGYALFDKAQLRSGFIAALRAYPLDPGSPPLLEGSNFVTGETAKSLRMTVMPYDRRGTLLVHVDLVSWGRQNPRSEKEHALTARFFTEYGLLARFADDLDAMLDGAKDAATLRSSQS